MDEDVGVKAPVTRLRRRLSVEQEDVSSPATPTKKRGGRLAAKPQLDLIKENAQVSSPRKTRRQSAVKDTADAEEKPVTPSRRSTRIKSNSSLVLETLTAQVTDSPRARRALRRNSQAGSDNEGPATPARQRRTRKDSASSVENQEPAKETRPLLQVPEMVITEEPEQEVQVTVNKSESFPRVDAEDLSPNAARKSKRLSEKRNRRSGSYKSESDTAANSEGNISLNSPTKKEKRKSTKSESSNILNKSSENVDITEKLSQSNINVIKSVNTDSKNLKSNHNKSTSDAEIFEKKKRNRTESWPTVTIPTPKDSVVFSDNERAKKKTGANSISLSNTSISDFNNSSSKVNSKNNKDTSIELKSKRKTSERSITTDPENVPDQPIQITKTNEDTLINTEKKSDKPEDNDIRREMPMLFEDTPSNVQAVVYFEDSDSNGGNSDAANKVKQSDSEDQCVPVVKHDIELDDKLSTSNSASNNKDVVLQSQSFNEKDFSNITNPKKSIDRVNDSCEPMDVDETLPEDVMRNTQTSLHDLNTEHNELSQVTNTAEDRYKSKRKSSISVQDTLDRSKNENKSTLVQSQIKDVSSISDISVKNSPKKANTLMSKSVLTDTAADNSNNEVMKTNISLSDLKGTPLRQKDLQKLTMQTSTPITAPTTNKTVVDKRKSDSINPDLSKSIDESSDENSDESDELSNPKSKYLDDEAEEASDNYESGDSRDEGERQYEDEHEIIERGETLGSDDDDSNDTDYEKDSFVVSSDAEDNELLSGTGEDLSISDNELTMSKKSKKKYNERKLKEQKNASREMFDSRHKLNTSESISPAPKTKNNRMRIDSSLLESDEEVVVNPKKGNRLRLESSTLDASMKHDDANVSNKKANKSINNQSILNEKEITVCNDVVDAKDPLLVEVKKEPKTPQKDLNISVVQFTAAPEIENVEIAESNSILNKTDPLQETMANEDYDSSENEEILQNYDSVLDELNESKKLKLNNNNISLNIGKKKKNNSASEAIVDQLNLTNSKKLKKAQKEASLDVVDSSKTKTTKKASKKHFDSEDECSSIDLQLLFSEDNCGSGDENVDHNNQQKDGDEEKMFIPLKKSAGKTNIRENIDMNRSSQNTSLNESIKKKKKHQSSGNFNESTVETEDANKSAINESIKKKGRKSSTTTETTEDMQDSNNAELNTSTKKKNRKSSVTELVEDHSVSDLNVSQQHTKKKNRKSSVTEQAEERQDNLTEGDTELNKSITKKDKRRSSLLVVEPEVQENINEVAPALNNSGKKKKKRKSSLASQEVPEPQSDLFFVDTTGAVNSDKDDNLSEKNASVELPSSGKTKKNKKKGKDHGEISQNMVAENDGDSDDAPAEVFYRSEKACDLDEEDLNTESQGAAETESIKKKRKKKKKKSAGLDQSGENAKAEVPLSNSNKRKRKSSDSQGNLTQGAQEMTENATLNESLSTGSHNKKRKTSHNEQDRAEDNIRNGEKESGKKKKNREIPLSFQNITPEPDTTQTTKKTKKRKERDEDTVNKKTKVSKDNSFQEVHLEPLPESILKQLVDGPSAKNKVVSTSKFIVENARQKRAKPSNYLEESVYLDDGSPLVKKEKPRMKKPKVLPFIPTASISDSGFTTNFKINKLSQNIQFVAEPTGIAFSKERYLHGEIKKDKMKRLGTYDLYKKQIHKRLSKF